jgi:hypothetical protein
LALDGFLGAFLIQNPSQEGLDKSSNSYYIYYINTNL